MQRNRNLLLSLTIGLIIGLFSFTQTIHGKTAVMYTVMGMFASYPYKYKGNRYSLLGGGFARGNENLFSLFGIIQVAENGDLLQIFGVSLLQKSHEGKITQWFGVSCLQESNKGEIIQYIGINLLQVSLQGHVLQCLGISLLQQSNSGQVVQIFGVVLYQDSKNDDVFQLIGINGVQISHNSRAVQGMGISFAQVAQKKTAQGIGLLGLQYSWANSQRAGLTLCRIGKTIYKRPWSVSFFTYPEEE